MSNATQAALRGRPRGGTEARSAFGGIDKSALRPPSGPPDYPTIQQSPEFRRLRRRLKWFVFPLTFVFLAWYLAYVLTSAYASDFMARPLFGEINVGLVMGAGQFVTTVAIMAGYALFARKYLDPQVDEIRREADSARQ